MNHSATFRGQLPGAAAIAAVIRQGERRKGGWPCRKRAKWQSGGLGRKARVLHDVCSFAGVASVEVPPFRIVHGLIQTHCQGTRFSLGQCKQAEKGGMNASSLSSISTARVPGVSESKLPDFEHFAWIGGSQPRDQRPLVVQAC